MEIKKDFFIRVTILKNKEEFAMVSFYKCKNDIPVITNILESFIIPEREYGKSKLLNYIMKSTSKIIGRNK